MSRPGALLCGLLLLAATPAAIAAIADISANKLPQETAVLAALDDARQMEPYSRSFASPWKYEITKDEVATRLGKDLGFLRNATAAHPDNAELLLLTGLVARYAYNVDVENSYDVAMDALGRAEKLAPSDIRAPWFRSTLQCQTMTPADGARGFLAIEDSHPWDKLPATFWDDYAECALVAGMPAHALRAADHLRQLHAPGSPTLTAFTEMAQKRFDAYDPNRKYEPKEVWAGEGAGDDPTFTSTMCGVRLRARGNWQIDQLGLAHGSCVAVFYSGPYNAVKHDLRPGIVLIAAQAKPGESLEDFLKGFMKKGFYSPDTPLHCPVDSCDAVKAVEPGTYKEDGDGLGRMIVFERDEPAYPGLIFESPWQVPKGDPNAGVQYYRPNQVRKRMSGKLYYLVLLDTAASIGQPAMQDFDFFLKNLTVE